MWESKMAALSAEIYFAQHLAGNTKKKRDQALKKLKRYLKSKSSSQKGGFSKDDFLRLWKGLHYCLWMQDKPVVQDELNETLSQLVHVLNTVDYQFLFIQTFFITQAREWNTIDVFRLDKFMSLIRLMINESLVVVKRANWQPQHLQQLTSIYAQELMSPSADSIPDGLRMHIADIYLEEVEKVGADQLNGEQLVQLLEPFIQFIREGKNGVVIRRVATRIFDTLILRGVALLKRQKDREAGVPEKKKKKTIPFESLKFDNKLLADHLFEVSKQPDMLARNRPLMYRLVKKFQDIDNGILPKEKTMEVGPGISRKEFQKAVRQLTTLEDIPQKKKKKKRKNGVDSDDENLDIDIAGLGDLVADEEEKENDDSDQNNNTTVPPNTEVPDSRVTNTTSTSKQKRKHSVDSSVSSDIPVKKMKRKSIDEGSEKRPLKKLKDKFMRSLKDSGKKDTEISQTPVANKSEKNKSRASTESGWSVTPMKTKTEVAESDQTVLVHKEVKVSKKAPPTLVITDKSSDTLKSAGQKRNYSEANTKSPKVTMSVDSSSTSSSTPVWTDEVQEGEVEIYVPSKKYKGKLAASPKPEFAKFDLTKPPMAYVKKAAGITPKTPSGAARYLSNKMEADGSAKKVCFNMKKNKSQSFKDSLKSPMTPYNPNKKPDQSILKTPDPSQTPDPTATKATPVSSKPNKTPSVPPVHIKLGNSKLQNTPVMKLVSHKPIKKATPMKKRSSAKDFFYL